MSIHDLYLSLLIVLIAGIAAGAMIALSARKNKETKLNLEAYCSQNGYSMEEIRERLHRATVIHGEGWRLSSGIQSSDVETQSGSTYTVAYTQWELTTKPERNTPLFWLGTVPGNAKRLSNAMLPLLSAFGIADMDRMHIVPMDDSLQDHFAMIAAESPVFEHAGADLLPLLQDWPENWPLRVSVGTESIVVNIEGKRINRPTELDQIIGFGTRLAAYRASVLIEE